VDPPKSRQPITRDGIGRIRNAQNGLSLSLSSTYGLLRDEAEIIARKFRGFGFDMYMLRAGDWQRILELPNCQSLFVLIDNFQNRKHALPGTRRFGSYKIEGNGGFIGT